MTQKVNKELFFLIKIISNKIDKIFVYKEIHRIKF